jgi:hypothetical protein
MPELRKAAPAVAAVAAVAAVVLACGALSLTGAVGVTGVVGVAARAASVTDGSAPVGWIPPRFEVPRAETNLGPALTELAVAGGKQETALFWAGPRVGASGSEISYETSGDLGQDIWSPVGIVPGEGQTGKAAITNRRPSAAPFSTAPEPEAIVAWEGADDQRVWYSVGVVVPSGRLTWPGGARTVPGAFTSSGPTVFSLLYSDSVFVTWEAAGGHQVSYIVGQIKGNSIRWGAVSRIPGADTTSAPSVAEARTGPGQGQLYVFWRAPGGKITGARTADLPPRGVAQWTPLRSALASGAGPAVAAIGSGNSYPLLVVYRAVKGSELLYATLNATGQLRHERAWIVPKLRSQDSPALNPQILAATDPGYIYYVRVCAGC